MSARVLHTGQAIVDIVLGIDRLPEPGGDTYAHDSRITAGGGFNVMAAAARDGAEVVYLGARGTGPFSDVVTAALAGEGIATPAEPVSGLDTGYCVALVDHTAERTFVSVLGAEGRSGIENLRAVVPTADDVVYVTGYSLLHETNRTALVEWLRELPAGSRVLVDPSPLVDEVPEVGWRAVREAAWTWTVNAREARLMLERLAREGAAESSPDEVVPASTADATTADTDDPAVLVAALAAGLGRQVVLRCGADGCWWCEPGGSPVHVPGHPVVAVDTNGAGDAHCGVLMAHLARGGSLLDGLRRANVAAAVAVTRPGPATSPTSREIDAIVHHDPQETA